MIDKADQLQKSILKLADESDCTIAEMVGALEVAKAVLLREAFSAADAEVKSVTEAPKAVELLPVIVTDTPTIKELPAMNPLN